MRSSDPIVITGSAMITSAGVGKGLAKAALLEKRSTLSPLPDQFDKGGGGKWGRVEDFKAGQFMPAMKARKLDRSSQFTVVTAGLTLADAGIVKGAVDPARIGISLGCGFGGIASSAEFLSGYYRAGVPGLSPIFFPNTVANAAAGNAAIEHQLKGPNITFSQRFCSAESAILAACRFIEQGEADMMLAGGVDELSWLMLSGFAATGQLRSYAAGFGEGAGMLLLERKSHALKRNARQLATINSISSIGFLPAGYEQQGVDRLMNRLTSCHQLFLSGAEEAAPPFLSAVSACNTVIPGQLLGRSLAMGGVVLGLLAELLPAGQHGLHLAASPEGPFYCISITGDSSD